MKIKGVISDMDGVIFDSEDAITTSSGGSDSGFIPPTPEEYEIIL